MKLIKPFTVLTFFQFLSYLRSHHVVVTSKLKLIFKEFTLRSKKSSDKVKAVKADAARKANADVAARIIIKTAIKVNTADVTVKINYLRNFKKQSYS